MSSSNRVFVARLAGTPVFDPIGDKVGTVYDVVVLFRLKGEPLAVGLVVEVAGKRRVFLPLTRVTSIDNGQVITTGLVNMRRFAQRPVETLVMAQLLDRNVRLRETGEEAAVVDAAIEKVRGREWRLTTLYVRTSKHAVGGHRSLIVPVRDVSGLTNPAADQGADAILAQISGLKAADVADMLRDLPEDRRQAVANQLTDERLADVLEELGDEDRVTILSSLDVERAADVLDVMQPDDAADLVAELPTDQAAQLLDRMEPGEADDIRRLLVYEERTAGGMMTTEPIVLPPEATIAQALASARRVDIPPALAAILFVCRPPLETPTGRFLGVVHIQRALREPPSTLIGNILDTDIEGIAPTEGLGTITRLLATYNLTALPVVDEGLLLGAVSVDDVLDHLLPDDWRDADDETTDEAMEAQHG
ncbi:MULTISPECIES: CBS domain-containing protein [unclassified Actinobaculum]|uniref:magnesium transporter MgtE N-terminal domain-containing protein n=1 Tax=unclassified Actinobaculum TaxID=2609299 RepID=UPI000D5288DE|nr:MULTISPECIES: CBS domain-containing protein [unclassified Actinobaculum]AWE42143.1 magnesium transporter [Actinobaculum sp. 313]RTE50705.1 CBS domain-containing protein [Actinobaculum sp. 352]